MFITRKKMLMEGQITSRMMITTKTLTIVVIVVIRKQLKKIDITASYIKHNETKKKKKIN